MKGNERKENEIKENSSNIVHKPWCKSNTRSNFIACCF
jgi:hypothetical protein